MYDSARQCDKESESPRGGRRSSAATVYEERSTVSLGTLSFLPIPGNYVGKAKYQDRRDVATGRMVMINRIEGEEVCT